MHQSINKLTHIRTKNEYIGLNDHAWFGCSPTVYRNTRFLLFSFRGHEGASSMCGMSFRIRHREYIRTSMWQPASRALVVTSPALVPAPPARHRRQRFGFSTLGVRRLVAPKNKQKMGASKNLPKSQNSHPWAPVAPI